ncbi:MAG: sigma factor-like helix-turn-helix DNA-binding protein [Gemmataceae bacterium]
MTIDDLHMKLRSRLPEAPATLQIWREVIDHPWTREEARRAASRAGGKGWSSAATEDLEHQTMVGLAERDLTALDLARPSQELGAYLRRLLRWEAGGAARRERRRGGGQPLASAPERSEGPDGSCEVWELIDRLPACQRWIVVLRVEGHTWADIARETGMPLPSAYRLFRKARLALADALLA